MKKTGEEQLKASIKQLNKKQRGKTIPIGDEIQWIIRERKDYEEQKLRKEMDIFRRELSLRIFPCDWGIESERYGVEMPEIDVTVTIMPSFKN